MNEGGRKIIKKWIVTVLALFVIIGNNGGVLVAEGFDNEMFVQNDILFYDPRPVEETNTAGGGWNGVIGECKFEEANNKLYDGSRAIFSKKQLDNIAKFSPVYKKAANIHNIPWQMIAVIHIRESAQRTTNHPNGQGIYQLYSWYNDPKKNGFLKMDFEGQTIVVAEYIKWKNKNLTKNSDADQIKKTFFMFNGTASKYKQQAIKLGFDINGANIGEGSPYVMNLADAKRDPKVQGTNGKWGQIKRDNGPIEYPANNDPGAFVMYQALTGIAPDGACRDKEGQPIQPLPSPSPDPDPIITGPSAERIRITAVGMSYKHRSDTYGKPNALYRKGLIMNNLLNHSGKDCGIFAGAVMRYSGADKNFPIRDTNAQNRYLQNNSGSGGKYVKIENKGGVGNLKPGDILVVPRIGNRSGHIVFYVGSVAGSYRSAHLKADASLDDADGKRGRVGGLFPIDTSLLHQTSGRRFLIYRIRN